VSEVANTQEQCDALLRQAEADQTLGPIMRALADIDWAAIYEAERVYALALAALNPNIILTTDRTHSAFAFA
jgi:hypothetical protein